jgi:putative flippase GtrA
MTSLAARAEHVWQRRHTPEARQLIKYTMVSVISTVASFGVLAIVYGLHIIKGEIEATVFANVVATVPSYFLNRMWVWGKGGRSHVMKEIVPFWVMSAIGIAVSIGGAAVARHIGTTHHLSHLQETGVLLLANLISFGLFCSSTCTRSRTSTSWWKRSESHSRPRGAFGSRRGLMATRAVRPASVPEVVELQRYPEVLGLAGRDHRLKVVALLRAHPQLVALGL